MPYQSPADFCAEYAEEHNSEQIDDSGGTTMFEAVTVVSETPDTARVEACWYTFGHAPDAGFYEATERTIYLLAKRTDGWHIVATEQLPYE